MAKTITDASLVILHTSGSTHNNVVRAIVECPVSEYQALIDLAGLTNAVEAATTTHILSAEDDGAV
jgi:hypothetical protein